MSRPASLLKHVAKAHVRPGAGPAFLHGLCQLSLFTDGAGAVAAPDALAAPCVDLVDEQQRAEDAWHARQDLLRAAQLRLAAERLWGFPNMVRNPDGPWGDLCGRAYDLTASRQCWPAYYLVRPGADDIQRITVHVRVGCDGIPAVPRAAAVLADLAPVSIAACTLAHPRHEAS